MTLDGSTPTDIERFIVKFVAKRMKVAPDSIDPTSSFEENGFDSLAAADLAVEFQNATHKLIEVTDLADFKTIRALSEHWSSFVCSQET